MQPGSFDCPICLEKYDISLRLPRFVPICGHTICSSCIPNLLKNSKDFTCPVGKEVQQGNFKSLDFFPVNLTLRCLVEKAQEFGLCEDHQKELQYVCIEDKTKVCYECALSGSHRKHDFKHLSDFKPLMEKKTEKLQDIVQEIEEHQRNIEEVHEHQRKAMLETTRSKFNDLRFIIQAKEAEFMSKINLFYDQEMSKLHFQVGDKSRTRQRIEAKISEYRHMTRNPNLFELLEEDLSVTLNIIQEAIKPDRIIKVNEFLHQMKMDIEAMLSSQLSSLENMRVAEHLILQKEVDLNLDAKLSLRKEFERYELIPPILSSPVLNNVSDIIVKGSRLLISYPFQTDITRNLKTLQEIGGNISCLEFNLLDNFEKISRQDILNLCYLRSRLTSIKGLAMTLENPRISGEALFNIFSSLFWQNDSLEALYLKSASSKFDDYALESLVANILPSLKNLKHVDLDLSRANVSNQSVKELLSSLPEEWFCQVTNLQIKFDNTKIADESISEFIEKTLAKFKALNEFEISAKNTHVSLNVKTQIKEWQKIISARQKQA